MDLYRAQIQHLCKLERIDCAQDIAAIQEHIATLQNQICEMKLNLRNQNNEAELNLQERQYNEANKTTRTTTTSSTDGTTINNNPFRAPLQQLLRRSGGHPTTTSITSVLPHASDCSTFFSFAVSTSTPAVDAGVVAMLTTPPSPPHRASSEQESNISSSQEIATLQEQIHALELKVRKRQDDANKQIESLHAEATAWTEQNTTGANERSHKEDATTMTTNSPPQELICPITLDVMHDPVVTADGHSYERYAIEKACLERAAQLFLPVSPCTNLPLESYDLIPNICIRSMCRRWEQESMAAALDTILPLGRLSPIISNSLLLESRKISPDVCIRREHDVREDEMGPHEAQDIPTIHEQTVDSGVIFRESEHDAIKRKRVTGMDFYEAQVQHVCEQERKACAQDIGKLQQQIGILELNIQERQHDANKGKGSATTIGATSNPFRAPNQQLLRRSVHSATTLVVATMPTSENDTRAFVSLLGPTTTTTSALSPDCEAGGSKCQSQHRHTECEQRTNSCAQDIATLREQIRDMKSKVRECQDKTRRRIESLQAEAAPPRRQHNSSDDDETHDDDATSLIPRELICPITLELMRDPVIAADGYSYECSAIQRLFQEGCSQNIPPVSPCTNTPLGCSTLIPNICLRSMCRRWEQESRTEQKDMTVADTILPFGKPISPCTNQLFVSSNLLPHVCGESGHAYKTEREVSSSDVVQMRRHSW